MGDTHMLSLLLKYGFDINSLDKPVIEIHPIYDIYRKLVSSLIFFSWRKYNGKIFLYRYIIILKKQLF